MGHGEFLWCDRATFDVEEILGFYASALGWGYRSERFQDGQDYHYARSGTDVVAGLYEMPAAFRKDGFASIWMNYIGIDDIESGITKAEMLGGARVLGPARFGQGAEIAMIRDPGGAVFTLFNGEHLQPKSRRAAQGRPFWSELRTPNPEVSAGFYSGLFGWKIDGPNEFGRYRVRNLADAMIASLQQINPIGTKLPASWRVTFGVRNPDDAARTIDANGGTGAPALGGEDDSLVATDPNGTEFTIAPAKSERGWWR